MSDGQVHTGGAPAARARQFIVTGDPESVRRLRTSGWVALILSLVCLNLAFALGWFVTYAFLWSPSASARAPELWFQATVLGCFLLWMALPVAVVMIPPLLVLDAWQLARVRIVVDHDGVSRQNPSETTTVPWAHIRHVAVTAGSRLERRLLIDDGSVPPSFWYRSKIRPGAAIRRLPPRRRQFLVNVPVSRLSVHETDLLEAVRHYSGGRFPNDYLR